MLVLYTDATAPFCIILSLSLSLFFSVLQHSLFFFNLFKTLAHAYIYSILYFSSLFSLVISIHVLGFFFWIFKHDWLILEKIYVHANIFLYQSFFFSSILFYFCGTKLKILFFLIYIYECQINWLTINIQMKEKIRGQIGASSLYPPPTFSSRFDSISFFFFLFFFISLFYLYVYCSNGRTRAFINTYL